MVRSAVPASLRVAALSLIASSAAAQAPAARDAGETIGLEPVTARAELKSQNGEVVGFVTFHDTPNGMLIRSVFSGLSPGTHGYHVHETGRCEPSFEAAGGHLNPTQQSHGFRTQKGPHAGDLTNLSVPDSGQLNIVQFASGLTAEQLFDGDGSAIVVHAKGDDYRTDPAGASGDRIACGVIARVGSPGAEAPAANEPENARER